MYLFRLLLLAACLASALCQFSLLSVPKRNRNSTKERKINTPNTVIHIKVGPKATFSNESISILSTQPSAKPASPETSTSSSLAKRSGAKPAGELNESDKIGESSGKLTNSNDNINEWAAVTSPKVPLSDPNGEATNETRPPGDSHSALQVEPSGSTPSSDQTNGNTSGRKPKFGLGSFSSLGDKLKPSIPSFDNKAKPGFPSFGDKLKPTIPSFGDQIKPTEIASQFGKLANETANKFKDIPIVSEFLKIPSYFKVNNLKGAMDYMLKYGHLESLIDVNKPQDLLNLKDAFTDFQKFFGLKTTGLFDQETLNLMNEPRCGLPDKETKFTKLVHTLSGGLIRKKRFELYSAKYEQRNLTWSVNEFSKKALRNQDEQVLEVFRRAFEVWENETNLSFEFKPNSNQTDIVIGFYSKAHGNSKFEPPFDGPNGTLAHTSYPIDFDYHIDDDENWSLFPTEGFTDLYTVSIHEIGHKLGLKHSKVKTACLFPIYNPKSTQLDPDDRSGIQSLYGAKYNQNETDNEVVDKTATEKPEPEEEATDDDNQPNDQPDTGRPDDGRPDGGRPDGNIPDGSRPDDGRPDGNRPDGNIPDGNIPDGGRPDDRPVEDNRPDERPSEEKQAIRISEFNPRRNIFSRREYQELTSTPCKDVNIDSSVCLRNNKCLVIAGDYNFWMNGRLRLMRRKKERNDVLFKGLQGKIDAAYRDGGLIHIIQGRNVTTYDSFYAEPVNRTTLDEHFPGFPKHVSEVHSVFKKLSSGVVYIYSGELYWRYTKSNGLESIPRLTFIWGLPGKIKSVLHFNNGKSLYLKNSRYWVFDETRNNLLSVLPGNISELNLCKNDQFGFLPFN